MSTCPVCDSQTAVTHPFPSEDQTEIICERCGKFRIADSVFASLKGISEKDEDALLKISFALRQRARQNFPYVWDTLSLTALASETVLPTFPEQLDNLIYCLGELASEAGQSLDFSESDISMVGARSLRNLGFITESAIRQGLVEGYCKPMADGTYVIRSIRLTLQGWTAYLNLKKGKTEGRQAFMAMKFGDAVLDRIYLYHFKGAVSDGFCANST